MFMFEEFLKKNSIGRASEYSPDKRKEIIGKFFQKENTKISLVVERFGKDYEYHFYLKDMLK